MELVSEAIAFAVKAHDGMRRKKSDAPYILHPMEAAVIVGTMTDDQNLIAAAVESETEDKRNDLPPEETWRSRKEESLAVLKNTDDLGVLMVWLGDKLANMRAIYRDFKVEGEAMWQRFNQKDASQQAWYYCTIATLTKALSHTMAWREYQTLTELVFGEGV